MLTSYWMTCPHLGCRWSGSLLPSRDTEAWRGAALALGTVSFRCPQCRQEWLARVIGDDVRALPLEEMIPEVTHA